MTHKKKYPAHRVNFMMPQDMFNWYAEQAEERQVTLTYLYLQALQSYRDNQTALAVMGDAKALSQFKNALEALSEKIASVDNRES